MNGHARPAPPSRLGQFLILLVLLDTVAAGLWLAARPAGLIDYLGLPPRSDIGAWQLFRSSASLPPPRDAGLGQLLGLLLLAQGACLATVFARPRRRAGLLLFPLVGRAITAGIALWALGTTATFPIHRSPFAERLPLVRLAAHEAAIALLLAGIVALVTWGRRQEELRS